MGVEAELGVGGSRPFCPESDLELELPTSTPWSEVADYIMSIGDYYGQIVTFLSEKRNKGGYARKRKPHCKHKDQASQRVEFQADKGYQQ